MRVVLATEFTSPRQGGIERQVDGLAHALGAAGLDPRILTPHPGPERPDTTRLALRRLGPIAVDPRAADAVRSALIALEPAAVHGHASTLTPFPWIAAREAHRLGIPALITLHSLPGPAPWLWRLLDREGLARRIRLSAVSRGVRTELARLAPGAEIALVPNGLEPGPAPVERPIRDRPVVIGAMRLSPRKRPWAFLGAVEAAGSPPARLLGDGPLRPLLARRARRLGVALPGWVPEDQVRSELDGADLFLHPTVREAFGLAPLEAAAAGLPVVCRAGSGPAEVLREGARVAQDDRELGAHLRTLAEDRALREALGAAGRRIALEHAWDRLMPGLMTLYAP